MPILSGALDLMYSAMSFTLLRRMNPYPLSVKFPIYVVVLK